MARTAPVTDWTHDFDVMEEAPPVEPGSPSRPLQLLMLSAKTEAALAAATWPRFLNGSQTSISVIFATLCRGDAARLPIDGPSLVPRSAMP